MAKLIFLGTSNAISDENHENTHMVVVGENRTVLIDCPNSPFQRFQKANVDINTLGDVILTHFHPDHVSGVPQLLMNMWLMGRLQPLRIYGLRHTIDRIESLMGLYGWAEWPDFFPVKFIRVPEQAMTPVLDCDEFRIIATPVQHFIPTIGLRIEFTRSKKVVAYSCDTEPCEQVTQLAEGADVLIHESSGALPGHSSAAQAGEAARQAEVGTLYLIHYPTGQFSSSDPVAEARQQFEGPVRLAQDYMTLDFTENQGT
jgi:ribonuclease Z